MRQRYWSTNGKITVKHDTTITSITYCRQNPPEHRLPIGSIPNQRSLQSFSFRHVGLNNAGPFDILDRKGRDSKLLECYVCVFVYFVRKAVWKSLPI